MAEELSSPHHYVACTGDYDCAADEHIEGCGIVDKRAALEHGQADESDAFDAAVIDLIRRFGLDDLACGNRDRQYRYDPGIYGPTVDVYEGDGRVRPINLDG